MIGIEVNIPVPAILASMRSNGLIALSAGENVIRLLPPLTASKEELQMALDIITTALKKNIETICIVEKIFSFMYKYKYVIINIQYQRGVRDERLFTFKQG